MSQPTGLINNEQNHSTKISSKETIIRRTTVAYGIAELLNRLNNSEKINEENIVKIDNFVVHISKHRESRPWDDIHGVGIISHGLKVTIDEPSYLYGLIDEEEDYGHMGRCLEVELSSSLASRPNSKSLFDVATAIGSERLNSRCQLFGRLLYELFTNEPFPTISEEDDSMTAPAQKKVKRSCDMSSRKMLMLSRAKGDFHRAELPFQIPCVARMQKMDVPASICLMTQNLMECMMKGEDCEPDNAYESLEDVCKDLHLLLLDPDRFLFDNDDQNNDGMSLLYRKNKLYGRDKEENRITDAFCRVSRGKSEAFFIGGFSGSGKSMLVNTLTDRVYCIGGYSVKHKFDPNSREKPLSGVISAFNQVCMMIRDKSRPVVAKKLREEFGVDFGLLMRLLPNISMLFPGNESVVVSTGASGDDTINTRSVCFTLLRFARVVSSPRHPIMVSRFV